MTKILVCGDVHCKLDVISSALKLFNKHGCDRLIFVGDYTDDWTASSEQNIAVLNTLRQLKMEMGDRLVLLLGNHDLSNWYAGGFKCSGFDEMIHNQLKYIYEANKRDFKLAHYENGFLFTHAGVSKKWLDMAIGDGRLDIDKEWKKNPEKLADFLNDIFHHIPDLLKRWNSPLWLRLNQEPMLDNILQVVGHTPVGTVCNVGTTIYVDTHSTRSNGYNMGDMTFGLIDEAGDMISISIND